MQETIKETLCRPVNWFMGDKEFFRRTHPPNFSRFSDVRFVGVVRSVVGLCK